MVVSVSPARATSITVQDTGDGPANAANCPGASCRLRDALAAVADNDSINFSVVGTITLTSGQLVVDKNITISGPGAHRLAIDGDAASRVFYISPDKTVVMSGLTITNGVAGTGGGIYNDHATLTVAGCTVSGNSANADFGGGIFNYDGEIATANLTVDYSTISGNSAADSGGGIANQTVFGTATVIVHNSTVTGNSAVNNGGGIFQDGFRGNAFVDIHKGTFGGNSAPNGSTIYNTRDINGSATIRAIGTIFKAGATGGNIVNNLGAVTSNGYNLSSDNTGPNNGTTDQINTDPLIGPLANNGGPTLTHELLSGSPAIDKGDPSFTPPPSFDQRRSPFTRVINGRIDIGAFEVQPCAEPPASLTNWWPANGNAFDIVGFKNGTLQGDAGFGVGKVDQAFSFDGVGDYVDAGSVNLTSTFTIDAWINPSSLSSQPIIVSKDDGSSRSYYFEIAGNGALGAEINSSAGDAQYLSAPGAVATGAWQHVAMTYNASAGADQKINFYVNGVLIPAAHIGANDSGGTPNATSLTTKIGIWGNGSNFPFTGLIDEVEFFNTALSQAQIAAIFTAGGTGKCKSPAAPVATAATNSTTASFKAHWTSVAAASGYRLDVATTNTFSSFVAGYNNLEVGNVTNYTVTGLTPGTTYFYRLRAYNGNGTSANSNTITAKTVPPAPVAKPATNVTSTSFTANWMSAAGAGSYRLDVSIASNFSSFVTGYQNRNVGNVLSFNITALAPNTPYYYRVRGANSGGISANSNVITALTAPPAPTATAATAVTRQAFTAHWNSVAGATGYRLDVSTSSTFSSFVSGYNNLNVGNTTSRTVLGLTKNTLYYYRVRSYNSGGTSGNSNVISVGTKK